MEDSFMSTQPQFAAPAMTQPVPPPAINPETAWQQLLRRDPAGRFFYAVATTGVFCRPDCKSRRPLRANVRFFPSIDAAAAAGFRPCKRCKPTATAWGRPLDLVRSHVERHLDRPVRLEELGRVAGMSPFTVQRLFKREMGVSPLQYQRALRAGSLRNSLKTGSNVTDAIYDAGFGSGSRVYERADARLGMTPNRYRQGGRGVEITYATAQSPLGLLLIAATDRGVCFVEFGKSERALVEALGKEYPDAALLPMRQPPGREFRRWMDGLARYLEGARPSLDLPLDVRATAFQMRVWNYLQTIPYGAVRSYGEVASAIGQPSAARAVARACASNRVALAIPCHRVIRGSGDPGGYRWGLERKRALLKMESGGATQAERRC